MSVGNSLWSVRAGGGQVRANAQQVARAIVHLDVSPLATPNVLIPIGDPASVPTLLDTGRLAEVCAFTAQKGQPKYAMAINPSVVGKVGTVSQVGTGTGTVTPSAAPHKAITIKCIGGGAIATATFQFSLDGGTTWSSTVTSAASWSSTGYQVPGTYCTLVFQAATYVATKTNVIGIDGTVSPGSGWVGTVTQTSSPIDDYEVVVTVLKGGALGTATASISLDNGISTFMASVLIPAGGVVALPGTGVYLTFASTFTASDVYSFLTIGPSGSVSDLQAALTALQTYKGLAASLIHVAAMPSGAAGAMSAAATLDTALLAAFSSGTFDWQGMCDCPSSKGGQRITSPLTGRKHLRPASWLAAEIYGRTDPKDELAAVALGPLRTFIPAGATSIVGPGDIVMPSSTPVYDTADTDSVIGAARGSDLTRTSVFVGGRDESLNPGLDDLQFNTLRTYNGIAHYLSISSGVAGWKNLTSNASYADAGALRGLNAMIAALRPVAQQLMGQRPAVNSDGTIAETPAAGYDMVLDGAVKRALGLIKGGDYAEAQASFATASVLRSSQLGQSPKRLDIAYVYQPLGEVTAVNNQVNFSGVLSLVS